MKVKSAATQVHREQPLVLGYKVDIARQESVKAMYDSLVEVFNARLDSLINNTAQMEPYKPFLESDPDTYWRTWEVNIQGLFNMARTFFPMLSEQSLQVVYGEQGLWASCVNPGAIKIKITAGALEAVRNVLPDRLAIAGDTIAWLASDRKEWLGGRYISCPWDMEELVAKKDEIAKEDALKLRLVV
ncbi:NADP(+)-dependent dehydrogenase [Fusarium acutatum]|uniref:NADP(+)-dependent dehydrogenase n=1 Tax=Fusarium acutatum TaxID=78861 RepID=A0A8H4J996_9HYPO|nr:NADP(+)-dependent dehydrogenase [Fusarium acutatum]